MRGAELESAGTLTLEDQVTASTASIADVVHVVSHVLAVKVHYANTSCSRKVRTVQRTASMRRIMLIQYMNGL